MPFEITRHLEDATYTKENPRVSEGVVGQKALIRRLDPTDKEDMLRLKSLQEVQQEDFFPKEELTDRKLVNWAKNTSQSQDIIIFGVVGSKEIFESEDEHGELQGAIYMYHQSERDTKKYQRMSLLDQPLPGQPVLELSFAKLKDAPSNQMASALRQVCVEIAHLDSSFHTVQTAKEVKQMMGFKEDVVLEGEDLSEFNKREEEYLRDKPSKPTQLVTLTISPRNEASKLVAESAGFRYKGDIPGTVDPDVDPIEQLYVLDWDLLQQRLLDDALKVEKQKNAFAEDQGPVENVKVIEESDKREYQRVLSKLHSVSDSKVENSDAVSTKASEDKI